MPIYMQFQGIQGSVTAAGHEHWIELHSATLGTHRRLTSASGRGTNREAAVPSVSEITLTKDLDSATMGLFRAGLWGEGKVVKIDFCKTDKDQFEAFFQVELHNVLVSAFSVAGTGGDSNARPTESLSLNFTKITITTTLMDAKNATGKPDRATWDLATGRGS
jgi:type VI secretion system secreted protein Hcp